MLPKRLDLADACFWILAAILATLIILPAFSQPPEDNIPITYSPNSKWLSIEHESGVVYTVRASAIIGFKQVNTGQRNAIMLINGKTLETVLSLDNFEQLILAQPGTTIKKYNAKGEEIK